MNLRTANKRHKRKLHVHRITGGYGFAFGGGIGTYTFCEICGKFLDKTFDIGE